MIAAGLWRVWDGGTYWYGFVPVSDQTTALYAAALGAVLLVAAHWLTRSCCGPTSGSPTRSSAPTRSSWPSGCGC